MRFYRKESNRIWVWLLAITLDCIARLAVGGPMPLKQSDAGAKNVSTNFPVTKISENVFGIGEVRLDSKKRSITFPASVNMTNGVIEYLLVSSRGKLHESLLKTEVEPMQLHTAKLLIEPKNTETNSSPQRRRDAEVDAGSETNGEHLSIWLSWRAGDMEKSCPAEDLIFSTHAKSPMNRGDWIYTGSRFIEGTFMAQRERSLVSVIADPDALIENPRPGRESDDAWQVNTTNTPPLNTRVQVTIQFWK